MVEQKHRIDDLVVVTLPAKVCGARLSHGALAYVVKIDGVGLVWVGAHQVRAAVEDDDD